jgi:hypothetical protein
MRVEVHLHGNIQLRAGVTLTQIEVALQPWLDYLDVENIDEAKSVHRDEPGVVFDARRRLLEICWTGDVGRNFRKIVEDSLQALCRYCEQATEIQLSYYHEDGRDEIGIVFVGPTPDTIHEAQRRRMVEGYLQYPVAAFQPVRSGGSRHARQRAILAQLDRTQRQRANQRVIRTHPERQRTQALALILALEAKAAVRGTAATTPRCPLLP